MCRIRSGHHADLNLPVRQQFLERPDHSHIRIPLLRLRTAALHNTHQFDPGTPRMIGAWNARPARPNPIRPTRTIAFSFLAEHRGTDLDGTLRGIASIRAAAFSPLPHSASDPGGAELLLPSVSAAGLVAAYHAFFGRSFTRITNFNPDQISLTAHTFTSTKPASSPIPRTSFSARSRGHTRTFLRPAHPQHAGRRELPGKVRKLLAQFRLTLDEDHDEVERSGSSPPGSARDCPGARL